METKHTPGPWNYMIDNNGNFIMSGNYCVARTADFSGNDETLSNAKLIAAAPEILEAIIKAHKEIESIISVLDNRITPEFAKTELGKRLVSFFESNAFLPE